MGRHAEYVLPVSMSARDVCSWGMLIPVLSDYAGLKRWSVTCVEVLWKFASYVATLPSQRCIRRILKWNIRGARRRGRPAYTWGTALQRYSIWKGGGNWIVEAAAYGHWMRWLQDFFPRCTPIDRINSGISFACALKGLPSGIHLRGKYSFNVEATLYCMRAFRGPPSGIQVSLIRSRAKVVF